jgi:type IV pilus biogenesis protein CpaD/CtpE
MTLVTKLFAMDVQTPSRRSILATLVAATAGCAREDRTETDAPSKTDTTVLDDGNGGTTETDTSTPTLSDPSVVESFTVQPTRAAETVAINVSLPVMPNSPRSNS